MKFLVLSPGNGFLFDTTKISVDITDVNDNAPVFIRPLFTGGELQSDNNNNNSNNNNNNKRSSRLVDYFKISTIDHQARHTNEHQKQISRV